jgi:Patatin-like phospholipase
MAAAARRNEFRILSLSGGGYLGLYTAALLARLEQEHGGPLGRRFDLIAGTSVGGMLALALAFEVPIRPPGPALPPAGRTLVARSRPGHRRGHARGHGHTAASGAGDDGIHPAQDAAGLFFPDDSRP